MGYLYIMEFYSATKKNEILSFAGKWMELKNIILRKVNQVTKPKATSFLWYVEYRTNTNIPFLWRTSHIKWRSHARGEV
jgi:hypothetical protein